MFLLICISGARQKPSFFITTTIHASQPTRNDPFATAVQRDMRKVSSLARELSYCYQTQELIFKSTALSYMSRPINRRRCQDDNSFSSSDAEEESVNSYATIVQRRFSNIFSDMASKDHFAGKVCSVPSPGATCCPSSSAISLEKLQFSCKLQSSV